MKDNNKEKRLMRRRGRPRKSETENSVVRKPRALRLSDEEEKYIAGNAARCRMNFSEYCRKVLMDYKPEWWKRLFPMIEFLDKKIERG